MPRTKTHVYWMVRKNHEICHSSDTRIVWASRKKVLFYPFALKYRGSAQKTSLISICDKTVAAAASLADMHAADKFRMFGVSDRMHLALRLLACATEMILISGEPCREATHTHTVNRQFPKLLFIMALCSLHWMISLTQTMYTVKSSRGETEYSPTTHCTHPHCSNSNPNLDINYPIGLVAVHRGRTKKRPVFAAHLGERYVCGCIWAAFECVCTHKFVRIICYMQCAYY